MLDRDKSRYSNTNNFKFGEKRGQFVRWQSGKRIKASKVKDIPEPVEIGPYHNIIIRKNELWKKNTWKLESDKSSILKLIKRCAPPYISICLYVYNNNLH